MPVSQQVLDHPDIHTLFEQMGGKTMPQRVYGDRTVEAGNADRVPASTLNRANGNRALGVRAWEEQVLEMRSPPIGSQDRKQLLRQHDARSGAQAC